MQAIPVGRVRVGSVVRALRLRRRWRQGDLAARAGVSQSLISLLERGFVEDTSIRTLQGVLRALEAELLLEVRWKGGALDRLLDEHHSAIAALATVALEEMGWTPAVEVSYAHYGEYGSIDILGWHAASASLLVVEVKSELTSVEATLRKHDEKVRLAGGIAAERFTWRPATVSRLLVLPDASTERRRVARRAALMDAAYPTRGLDVRRWLRAPSGRLSGIWFLSPTPGSGTRSASVTCRRVRASSAWASRA